jgi:hypothetical protein
MVETLQICVLQSEGKHLCGQVGTSESRNAKAGSGTAFAKTPKSNPKLQRPTRRLPACLRTVTEPGRARDDLGEVAMAKKEMLLMAGRECLWVS